MARVKIVNGRTRGKRQWHKHVTAVDKSKDNGYAFEGEFLNDGEHDLPVGAIVISKDPNPSRRDPYGAIARCMRVEPDGTLTTTNRQESKSWLDGQDWNEEFLSFRDHVAEQLAVSQGQPAPNPLAGFTDEEIVAEAKRRGLM